jgi:hypothetical protein
MIISILMLIGFFIIPYIGIKLSDKFLVNDLNQKEGESDYDHIIRISFRNQ